MAVDLTTAKKAPLHVGDTIGVLTKNGSRKVTVVGLVGLDKAPSFAGAALVGPADTFGKVLFPQFALALIFAIMALVLLMRPTGLLGRVRITR